MGDIDLEVLPPEQGLIVRENAISNKELYKLNGKLELELDPSQEVLTNVGIEYIAVLINSDVYYYKVKFGEVVEGKSLCDYILLDDGINHTIEIRNRNRNLQKYLKYKNKYFNMKNKMNI